MNLLALSHTQPPPVLSMDMYPTGQLAQFSGSTAIATAYVAPGITDANATSPARLVAKFTVTESKPVVDATQVTLTTDYSAINPSAGAIKITSTITFGQVRSRLVCLFVSTLTQNHTTRPPISMSRSPQVLTLFKGPYRLKLTPLQPPRIFFPRIPLPQVTAPCLSATSSHMVFLPPAWLMSLHLMLIRKWPRNRTPQSPR